MPQFREHLLSLGLQSPGQLPRDRTFDLERRSLPRSEVSSQIEARPPEPSGEQATDEFNHGSMEVRGWVHGRSEVPFEAFDFLLQHRREPMLDQINVAKIDAQGRRDPADGPLLHHIEIENLKLLRPCLCL